jgi:hypothetical protein
MKHDDFNAFHNFQACWKNTWQEVYKLTTCSLSVVLVLSAIKIDGPYFQSSQISQWAISTDNVLRACDTLASTDELTRLTNAHQYRAAVIYHNPMH